MEQAGFLTIVQRLQSERTVGREAVQPFHAEQLATLGFLVVEVVLTVIRAFAVNGLRTEYVDRETVNGSAYVHGRHILPGLLILVALRRCQKPKLLHHFVEQLRTTGVEAHRRIAVIALTAQQTHGDAAGSQGIGFLLHRLTVYLHAEASASLRQIDADILARIFRRARALNADVAVVKHKVILLAERTVEIDVGQEVDLLVVCLVHLVKAAFPHNAHHALALGPEFVNVHVACLTDDVILAPQLHHLISRGGIHHAVLQLLVVSQRTVIDAYVSHFKVGSVAVQRDAYWRVLLEVVAAVIDVGTGTVAVHVEFHQPPVGTLADDECHLQPDVRGELRAYLYLAARVLAVLVGVVQDGAGLDARLHGSHAQALSAAHAADHLCHAVAHVAHFELHLDGLARNPGVGLEKLTADDGLRAVRQQQRVTRPAVALPVKALERRSNAVRLPSGGIALTVAATRRAQFHGQPIGGLADVNAALRHVHVEGVGRLTHGEDHGLPSLVREAVLIVLRRPCHAHRLHHAPVVADGQFCRCGSGVIGHERKRALLILSHANRRLGIFRGRHDASVGIGHHQPYERNISAALEYVDVYTLALQCQTVPGIHLRHHLYVVPSHAQTAHGDVEAPIRRAASRHALRASLIAVHIEKNGLRAAAAHAVGYAHCLAHPVATFRQCVGKVV